VPQLIALNDLQRDVGRPGRGPWVDDMVTTITEGRVGYCELHALRAHDPALLDRLQRIAESSHDLDVATADVVHCDFTTYNILFDDDQVTGVIDWSGATSGDAAFDLVSLAFYTYDPILHEEILTAARARTDARALQLYAAHMTLRQVDWSLRNHDGDLVQWHTDAGLALLAAVGAG
jgi:thiamine kinase-like enzyme